MRIEVITIFPDFFTSPLDCSIVGRARQAEALAVEVHDLRNWATDKHRVVDDYPYGGGAGMVMKPEPLVLAVEDLLNGASPDCPVILLTPQGQQFDQAKAEELAEHDRLILLCGHYEGVDERVRQSVVTEELSIGDYILTGGEPAALVVIEAVARLLPGVLGNPASLDSESFGGGLLEYPHYTRPAQWRGMSVPEVLLSGHHQKIRRWRHKQALCRTRKRRPELLEQLELTEQARELLAELEAECDQD